MILGQRRHGFAMLHIRPIAAGMQRDRRAIFRMLADFLARAAALTLLLRRFGQQNHGAIDADGGGIVFFERRVSAVMLQIGAEAADAGFDDFPRFRMIADLPRQGEQAQRDLKIHIRGRLGFRQPLALRLVFRSFRRAQLHIPAVRAFAQRDVETGFGILAQNLGPRIRLTLFAFAAEGAGEFAFGIVRTAHKGAELAQFDR